MSANRALSSFFNFMEQYGFNDSEVMGKLEEIFALRSVIKGVINPTEFKFNNDDGYPVFCLLNLLKDIISIIPKEMEGNKIEHNYYQLVKYQYERLFPNPNSSKGEKLVILNKIISDYKQLIINSL